MIGAAALVDDGRIVVGCNVENASYGVGLCAECGLVSALHATGGGRLVALAVSGAKRSPLLPEVPTVAESGFPGFDASFSLVLFAPKGLPQPIMDAMSKALTSALRSPDVVERLRASDQEVVAASPADTAARLAADTRTWGAVARRIGLQQD